LFIMAPSYDLSANACSLTEASRSIKGPDDG